jgi:hypothetical protein
VTGPGNETVTAFAQDERVKTNSFDRTGILIVRLWIEQNTGGGFRARITQTHDSSGRQQAMATAGNPEDLYTAVRTWVEAFVQQN